MNWIRVFVGSCITLFIFSQCGWEKDKNIKCVLDFSQNSIYISDSNFVIERIRFISIDVSNNLKEYKVIDIDTPVNTYNFTSSDSVSLRSVKKAKNSFAVEIFANEINERNRKVPLYYYYKSDSNSLSENERVTINPKLR